jgi:hypothetical protein
MQHKENWIICVNMYLTYPINMQDYYYLQESLLDNLDKRHHNKGKRRPNKKLDLHSRTKKSYKPQPLPTEKHTYSFKHLVNEVEKIEKERVVGRELLEDSLMRWSRYIIVRENAIEKKKMSWSIVYSIDTYYKTNMIFNLAGICLSVLGKTYI